MSYNIISAVPTPFNKSFKVDNSKIRMLYNYIIKKNINGVLINGTVGESLSLSIAERMSILEEWLKIIKNRKNFSVLVNISCESIEDAKSLSRHASECGVEGVLCHSPSFFKLDNIDSLINFCKPIALQCHNIPFYFYYLPDFTNFKYNMNHLVPKTKKIISNFRGLKFTDSNLADLAICIKDFPEYNFFLGRDELFFQSLNIGVNNFIGGTYCLFSEKYIKILELFNKNKINEAKEEYINTCKLTTLISNYGGIRAIKSIFKIQGIDCGPLRAPLKNMTDNEFKKLESYFTNYAR